MKISPSIPRTALGAAGLTVAFFCFTPSSAIAQSALIISVPESIRADSSQPAGALSSIEQNNFSAQPLSKSHAPEPPTLLLFISGVTAMIIRFARKSFRAFKRVLDPVLALTAIAICSPLFIVIAFLVRITSEGPVIYLQERVGKRGKSFMMFKFRTMSVDAEKGIGAVWAKQNDPRVTQVGGILRTTHFDELPQLLNVLKGEMSIVGPRPERPQIVKDLRKSIVDYDKRLAVLPGITGLSQVLHRADESINDVRKKVKYDLLYIKKMCWLMELRVMTSTVFVMLSGKSVRFN